MVGDALNGRIEREMLNACKTGDLKQLKAMVTVYKGNPFSSYYWDNLRPSKEWWPFMCAIDNGHFEIVKYLSSLSKANAAIRDNEAICLAAELGNLKIIKYLIKLPGVDIRAQNDMPRKLAKIYGHDAVVRFIVSLLVPGIKVEI